MEHNRKNLEAHILPLSAAKSFNDARLEWKLIHIELSDDWDNCPCGQSIKELCHIKNTKNGHETYVGNVCINNFLGINTGNLFDGLKRIKENPSANANSDLIQHAYNLGYIFEKELNFLQQTRLKRNLSTKQKEWNEKINRRIISKTIVRKSSKNR